MSQSELQSLAEETMRNTFASQVFSTLISQTTRTATGKSPPHALKVIE